MKHLGILLLLALAITGCQGGSPSASAPPQTGDVASGKVPTAAPPIANPASVPEALRHDGFQYYGLEGGKSVNLEIRASNNTNVYTGSQKATFQGITKEGTATYLMERTGGLAEMLGAKQMVMVDEKGVEAVSIDDEPITPNQIELVAKLSPGTTWKVKSTFTLKGQKFQTDMVSKVIGPTKVKTKLGEFDAMLVTSDGVNVVSGQKLTISAQTWYVKGIGEAKIVLKSKDATGKTAELTVEAVK